MNDADKSRSPSPDEGPPPITLEWLAEGRIARFTMLNVARSTIDQWISMIKDVMRQWPPDRRYLVLIDVSAHGVSFTPYLRQRINELDSVNPSLKGRVALIMTQTFVAQMARLYLRTARRSGINFAIFFKREAGMEWLKQLLDA